MSRIFISYARADRAMAERIYQDLERYRLDPWLDAKNLLTGQNWKIEIIKAIRDAQFFLAIISEQSMSKKGFVQRELKVALEVLGDLPPDEIFILPVRIEDCSIRIPQLQELHWVDLFHDYERGMEQILKTVRSRLADLRIVSRGELRNAPAREARLKFERSTFVHVEDEWIYERFLASRFRGGIDYIRAGLLSEAGPLVSDPNTAGFIVDIWLPPEESSSFEDWGGYPHNSLGLIEKIHMERPELPIVVLTNFVEDQRLTQALKQGWLSRRDVFNKMLLEDEVETLVERLRQST